MGYFDNPEATKSIMTLDGFLRTGDVGYVDENGFVHIQDRIKEIIKVWEPHLGVISLSNQHN